jgi:hypothetical protein
MTVCSQPQHANRQTSFHFVVGLMYITLPKCNINARVIELEICAAGCVSSAQQSLFMS